MPFYFSNLILQFAKLKTYIKRNGGIQLEISPNIDYKIYDNQYNVSYENDSDLIYTMKKCGFRHQGFPVGYEKQQSIALWQYVKNISNFTDESLTSSFEKNGIYSLKKANSFGIKIRNLEYNELDSFKSLTSSSAQLHNFHDKELEYYQLFYKYFGEKADFLVAEIDFSVYRNELIEKIKELELKISASTSLKKEKKRKEYENQIASHKKRLSEIEQMIKDEKKEKTILSSAIIIYNKFETTYFISGTNDKYRKLYSPYLIQNEAMKRSIKKEIATYNFYGISGNFDGTDGILNFKKHFNGHIVQKIGTFIYYPNPVKHQTIHTVKKLFGRM